MIQDSEFNEDQEMFLERLWFLKEKGKNTQRALMGTREQGGRHELLAQFQKTGYMKVDGEHVDFTPKGEACARNFIRRRRLTEVLLYNVLKLEMHTVETSACKIEHIINEEVTESICAFLGHPLQCPHGGPIPRGKCCGERGENIEPLIKALDKMPIGKKTKVVFIASDEGGVLRRLTSLGVYPGAVVNIRQHQPTAVLRVGETDIALEPALVGRIYCRLLA
jgi:DtxR family transcriptional regulator, Mn-dependent transcriptional regulator